MNVVFLVYFSNQKFDRARPAEAESEDVNFSEVESRCSSSSSVDFFMVPSLGLTDYLLSIFRKGT